MLQGLLLCGGAGSRIGGEKAQRELAGRPLSAYGRDLLSASCARVWALGVPLPGCRFLPDLHPGEGPLRTLHDAFERIEGGWFQVLAVDTPLLGAGVLEQLALRSQTGSCSAYLPRHRGGAEPLCGLYHSSCRASMGQALQAGVRSLKGWLSRQEGVEWVDFAQTRPFWNVNTPHQLEVARRWLRRFGEASLA